MENRVLVFMPTGRDASLVCQTLEEAEISAVPCADAKDLEEQDQLRHGRGFACRGSSAKRDARTAHRNF